MYGRRISNRSRARVPSDRLICERIVLACFVPRHSDDGGVVPYWPPTPRRCLLPGHHRVRARFIRRPPRRPSISFRPIRALLPSRGARSARYRHDRRRHARTVRDVPKVPEYIFPKFVRHLHLPPLKKKTTRFHRRSHPGGGSKFVPCSARREHFSTSEKFARLLLSRAIQKKNRSLLYNARYMRVRSVYVFFIVAYFYRFNFIFVYASLLIYTYR